MEIPVSVQIDRLKSLRHDLETDLKEAVRWGDDEMARRKRERIKAINAKILKLEKENQ